MQLAEEVAVTPAETATPHTEGGTTDKLYKAEYVGSGTFLISKPKRKKNKARQTKLKNLTRGSRK